MRQHECPSCGGTGTSSGLGIYGVLQCQRCAALYTTTPVDKEAVKALVRWDRLRVIDVPEEDERDFDFRFTDGSAVSGVFDVVSREVVHY
jgi:hypothetical protein